MDNKERFLLLKAKLAGFFRARGVYVVLFLCLSTIGAAAAIAFLPGETGEAKPPVSEVDLSGDERLGTLFTPVPQKSSIPTPTPVPTPSPTPIPDFTKAPESTAAAVKNDEKLTAPLSGEVIWDYAMNELIYSKTLDQWTTHAGVDIKSPKGTEVYCVMGGVVEKVYEDDSLGVCVLIAHAGDVMTLYANLKAEPPVHDGQKVDARTLIGYVGDSAISECGTASHLHFEYLAGGKPCDPKDKVRFDKAS